MKVMNLHNSNYYSLNPIVEKSNQQLHTLIEPVIAEIGITQSMNLGYSNPIDPLMAHANNGGVYVCPLFTVDLELIPEAIRPKNAEDPRLYDLAFLQQLSNWLAQIFNLKPEPVNTMHIAACKTILRLREDPKKFQLAAKAGIAHELAHVVLKHCDIIQPAQNELNKYEGNWYWLNPNKWMSYWKMLSLTKQCEREADQFASTKIKNGVDGIVIGFRAWQNSLIELRQNSALPWKDRLLFKIMVSPWGNPLPLFLTHGSFDQRIHWAQNDIQKV
jgi:hypothetical protein